MVYAPLQRILMRLTPSQVDVLARIRMGKETAADREFPFVRALEDAVSNQGDGPLTPSCGIPPGEYLPSRLTLFMTTACNLRCVYCYAHAGEQQTTMPIEIGKAAIDSLFLFAEKAGRQHVDVGFHGGGEPTCAWKELTELVEYASHKAETTGVTCDFSLASNGYMTKRQAAWVGSRFRSVNLSLDGAPDLQDRQRPRYDGGPSSPVLRRTMRTLHQSGCRYAVQATVLRNAMASMPATVRYVARHTNATELKFEPVMPDGRFRGQEPSVPPADEFADHFGKAHALGLQKGVKVMFSALRLFGRPLSCFCGAFDTPFGVTPDGHVSACFESFTGNSDHRDAFLFGSFNPVNSAFDIDHKKLARLRMRHVANMPTCKDCFCKYACAGDCASRNFYHFGKQDFFAVGARCELIRAVVKRHLQRIIHASVDGGVSTIPEKGETP